MDERQTLLPCPSGCVVTESEIITQHYTNPESLRYNVICECGWEGPECVTQAEAIAAWNTRVSPAPAGDDARGRDSFDEWADDYLHRQYPFYAKDTVRDVSRSLRDQLYSAWVASRAALSAPPSGEGVDIPTMKLDIIQDINDTEDLNDPFEMSAGDIIDLVFEYIQNHIGPLSAAPVATPTAGDGLLDEMSNCWLAARDYRNWDQVPTQITQRGDSIAKYHALKPQAALKQADGKDGAGV